MVYSNCHSFQEFFYSEIKYRPSAALLYCDKFGKLIGGILFSGAQKMKLSKFKPVSGIYKICNTKNGKIYVGQSFNIWLRWSNHVNDLVSKKHSNRDLLEDFQCYGIDSFTVEIIEKCSSDKNVLLSKERYWITQYYQQGETLYNKNLDKFWYVDNDGKNYNEIMENKSDGLNFFNTKRAQIKQMSDTAKAQRQKRV